MTQPHPGIKRRVQWLMGVMAAWSGCWAVLGMRYASAMRKHPHPFLPELKLTGIMLRALAEWALLALAAHAAVGLVSAMILFTIWILGRPTAAHPALSFRRGLLLGLGSILLIHTLLLWEVPTALSSFPLLGHLPMGLVLAVLTGLALGLVGRGLTAGRSVSDWTRIALGTLAIGLLMQLPHDIFRRSMPLPPAIAPEQSRLLIYSLDGCRQDALELVAPALKAPPEVQPISAVPATRITWNILLGGDPAKLTRGFVIPFAEEWTEASSARLIEEANQKGITSAFVIDDSTTLSFGLTRARFSEVLEPRGGWKHFFTVGAGACWPVYSMVENYISPVETTNPWSDFRAYNRDVQRALRSNRMVFSHSCQLHAPFYPRREEIQELRPRSWLLHTAYSYESYQTYEQALETKFDRQDGRSNPRNHYRIRLKRLMALTQPEFTEWTRRYPALSGLLTSDHGESFAPVVDPSQTLVNYLTGVHGFNLEPDTLKVPLHAFGTTSLKNLEPGAFSWFDLRGCLKAWVEAPGPLDLKRMAPEGWLLSFPTIQAVTLMNDANAAEPSSAGAGIAPATLARNVYLNPFGIWYMDNPSDLRDPVMSRALIRGNTMTTLNPLGHDRWARHVWKDYQLQDNSEVDTATANKEVAAFSGKRPEHVFAQPPTRAAAPPKPGR